MKWNYFTRAVPEKHPRHIISDRLGGKAYIQVLFLTLLVLQAFVAPNIQECRLLKRFIAINITRTIPASWEAKSQ